MKLNEPLMIKNENQQRKVVYKITYPNGKIYIGQDITDDINYFGSPDKKLLEIDYTPTNRVKFTVTKEVLWDIIEEKGYSEIVNQKETEFILKLQSNNPKIEYKKNPKYIELD